MIREEQEFLQGVATKIDKLIDKEFERDGIDRAFFNFKLSCTVLSSDLCDPLVSYQLINDTESLCTFCNAETYYYDRKLGKNICPICLGKLDAAKSEVL